MNDYDNLISDVAMSDLAIFSKKQCDAFIEAGFTKKEALELTKTELATICNLALNNGR